MRRRQFLAAAAGAATLPVTGVTGATDSVTLRPLGRTSLDGLKEAVVGPDGETIYAAATDGFAVFDLSDPTDPTVLADRRDLLADAENGPLRGIQDVKVDGDRRAVVGPANRRADAVQAALFYDVTDPAAPQQVGVFRTDYPIHNCDVADGHAFLTANGGGRTALEVVSVGSDPALVGTWSLTDHDERWSEVAPGLRSLHDVHVQDGRAYLAHWDAGTWLLDVTDPAGPEFVTRVRGQPVERFRDLGRNAANVESVEPPGNDHYVAVNEDASLLGVGMESWDLDLGQEDVVGGPSGIDLYDISTPTDPERVGSIPPPPTPDPTYQGVWTTSHNFDFAGDRLYTSWYQGGVRVYDVSDPTNPGELARWESRETTSFWTAQSFAGGFVASSRRDPSDPRAPGALFVFPDPPADAEPVPVTAVGDAAIDGTTATATADTATQPTTRTPTETTVSDADGPGFGVLGAVGALGAGAALRRWRSDSD